MRLLTVLFVLYNFAAFAQPITVTVDALIAEETESQQREFKLTYRVINNTADTLKLFFKSNAVSRSDESHNAAIAYYKIYEEDSFVSVGSILTTKGVSISRFSFVVEDGNESEEDFEKKYMTFLSQQYETPMDSIQNLYTAEGFEGLLQFEGKKYFAFQEKRKMHYQVLAPHQQLECTASFYWNKNRYYYSEPHEFYLDENAKHYFEITLVALKEEFKDKLDAELYDKIMKEPNFIKGVFVSNKVEIDFNTN
ncbi:hypothetical protein [Flavobacterium sp. SM2513]|uniref:hypothetical protein n=1 Tax=Flavobacterium sp. SM2513 TaxID=3424766 RepID=UPI003D7FBF9C